VKEFHRTLLSQIIATAAKGVNVAASAALTIMLARFSAPGTLGQYAIGLQTAQLVAVACVMGLDQIALRQLSRDRRTGDLAGARQLITACLRRIVPVSFAAGIVVAGIATHIDDPDLRRVVMLAAAFVVAQTIYVFLLYGLRGLATGLVSQFLEGAYVVPVAVLVAVMAAQGNPVGSATAMIASIVSMGVLIGILLLFLAQHTGGGGAAKQDAVRIETASGFRFMAAGLTIALTQWLPIGILGLFFSEELAGAFRACFQLIMVVAMIETVSSGLIASGISGDLHEGKIDAVEKRYSDARIIVAVVGVPLLSLFILFPAPVMGFLFGNGFTASASILRWLALGQLICTVVGPAGGILTMAGHEGLALNIAAGGLIVMAGVALLIVPSMGVEGIAAAFAIALAMKSILTYLYARRTLAALRRAAA
jgi:O-antigen/teichoic acid export membrane protein